MISIVIPLYNKAHIVADTLQSVLNQTFTDFEVIIVNDGSTDNSIEIVQRFNDSRIRIFSKPNGGVSSARNYGIRQAKGKYIAFLDADDLWKPEFLSEMQRLIKEYPDCGIYSSGYVFVKKTRKIPQTYFKEGIIKDYFKEYFKYKTPLCHTSCIIIPVVVFREIGFFPENLFVGEDLYMWMAVAKKYNVCVTPRQLMIYHYEEANYQARRMKAHTSENCSLINLYDPNNFYLNEVIAFLGIAEGISQATINNKSYSILSEETYNYTKLNRKALLYLRFLNRTPSWGLFLIRKGRRTGSILKNHLCGILDK